jgi:hypothetical protein
MNDVLDFGGHFLPLGWDRFFKRGGFSTATPVNNSYPAPTLRMTQEKSRPRHEICELSLALTRPFASYFVTGAKPIQVLQFRQARLHHESEQPRGQTQEYKRVTQPSSEARSHRLNGNPEVII